MSARGEVGVCVVERPVRQDDAEVRPLYVSARVPRWLAEAAERRGWHEVLTTAIESAASACAFGERVRAERWAQVADSIARAVAAEARVEEIQGGAQ